MTNLSIIPHEFCATQLCYDTQLSLEFLHSTLGDGGEEACEAKGTAFANVGASTCHQLLSILRVIGREIDEE